MKVKGIRKGRVVLMVLAFIVVFIVAMALLWTPQVSYSADYESFKVNNILKPEDVDALNNCEVDEDGNVNILSFDPYIIFAGLNEQSPVIKINFATPIECDTEIEVFINEGYGFTEDVKIKQLLKKGDTEAYVFIGAHAYIELRLDVNINYQFESIEFGTADMIENDVSNRPYWPLYAMISGVLAAAIVYIWDEKRNITDRVLHALYIFKKNFWRGFLSLIGIGGVSVFLSLLWKGRPSLEPYYIYMFLIRTAFIFSILCAIACLVHYRRTLVEHIERVFVQLLLLVGMSMILFTPLAHASWDTESHYKWALETSYLGDVHWTQSDLWVVNVGSASKMKSDPQEHFNNMAVLTLAHQEVIHSYNAQISVSHLPQGVFLALGRLMNLPYMFLYMFGKVGSLLLYTTLCYFAMKKLKYGKMIVALIALLPTNIFLACNYSYDYWVTGFSILGVSYFVGELQDRTKQISVKDTIIMCGALGLACLPKLVYFPILLIPFFMPKNKIKNRKIYYAICCMVFVVLFQKFFVRSVAETSGTGDIRGGAVGPGDQLAFIFSDIFNYARILLNFLFGQYLTIANMDNYICNFAYLGMNFGRGTWLVLMAIFLILFDKGMFYEEQVKSTWLTKIYVILMYFGGAALVATALYIAYTPVGHPTVLGCQARYMIPWILPALLVLAINKIKPVIPQKFTYWLTMLSCFGFLYYDLFTIFLPNVINV